MGRILRFLFEDNPDWVGPKILNYLLAHPTYLLTLLYLAISGLGLLFEIALFAMFGINVLDYSEAADFFLAAFKRPSAFILALIMAATLVYYRILANFVRRIKRAWLRYSLIIFVWIGLFRREILIPAAVALFAWSYWTSASIEAHRLALSEETIVSVSVRFGDTQAFRLIPIGATESFLFGIEYNDELTAQRKSENPETVMLSVQAIPFANIAGITYGKAKISPFAD